MLYPLGLEMKREKDKKVIPDPIDDSLEGKGMGKVAATVYLVSSSWWLLLGT